MGIGSLLGISRCVDEKHVGSYPIVKANHHEISGLKDKE